MVRKVRGVLEVLGVLVLIGFVRPPYAASADAPDILVSRQLLAKAHLAVGDLVTLAALPVLGDV